MKGKHNEQSFLVFKRKDISFEIPDDYPEENIPKFTNMEEFKKWYALQNFEPFRVVDLDDDDQVIHIAQSRLAKDSIKALVDDLHKYKHLIEGEGWIQRFAFSLGPEGYFYELANTYLPVEVYQKLKGKLLKKYPDKTFTEIVNDLTQENDYYLTTSSEHFIQFLYDEGIRFPKNNIFNLNFSKIGNFEDETEWDEDDDPPFTLKKLTLLLEMCSTRIHKDNIHIASYEILKLIQSTQWDKLNLLIEKGIFTKPLIQAIFEKGEDIPVEIKAKLLALWGDK